MKSSFLAATAIAGCLAASGFGQGTWSTTANVTSGQPDNYAASVAIDPAGNSTVAFIGLVQMTSQVTNIYASSAAPGGIWTAPVMISNTGRAESPLLLVDTLGNAAAAWTSFLDAQIAVKPFGSPWNMGQNVGSTLLGAQFLMNGAGDQALVWTTSAPLGLNVSAMRKPASGVWSAPQIIAQGNGQTNFVQAGKASLGDSGDLVVPYESFRLYCPPPGACSNVNWTLRVARQSAAGGAWAVSPALAGPGNKSHYAVTVADASGTAGLAYRVGLTVYAASQTAPDQPWSPAALLYTSTQGAALGMGTSSAGLATVFTTDAGKVIAIDGQLGSNTWNPAAVLSGADNSAKSVAFAVSTSGAAIAAWNGPATGNRNAVRAALRMPGGAWGAPQTASSALPVASPTSAAINPSGQAVVGIKANLTSYSRAVYVTRYQP